MKRLISITVAGWLLLSGLCSAPISAQVENRLSHRDSLWRAYLEKINNTPYILAEKAMASPNGSVGDDTAYPLVITRDGKRKALRGDEDKPQIYMKTSKAIGEKLIYKITVTANTSLDIDAGDGTWTTVDPLTAWTHTMQTDLLGDYVIIRGEGITALDINYSDVTQLDVSTYPDLKSLNCNGNKIGTLDVSKLTGLTVLQCAYIGLSNLDLTGLTALQELTCSGNNLTTLDISGQTGLTRLDCSVNKLTALNVAAHTNLYYLDCNENELTALDVTGLNRLFYLYCELNKLQTLTLGSLQTLTTMDCDNNNLRTLDASQCTALGGLRCAFNELEQLALPSTKNLQLLACSNNKLTSLDVSGFDKLTTFWCSNNQLTALPLTGCVYLGDFNCGNNKLTSLDFSDNASLHTLSCRNNQLETLDLSHLTKLRNYLYCYGNKLKTIHFPTGSNITALYINDNAFESLDVSLLTNLGLLDCDNNKLPSMDFLQNPKLYQITCAGNLLTTVDVRGLQDLRYFDCSNNRLTSILTGDNPSLLSIVCHTNYLHLSLLPAYRSGMVYYGYFPQYPIERQGPIDASQALDLSAELTCMKSGQPLTTLYRWYKILPSGKKELIESGITGYEDGIFRFDESMNGKKMTCEMLNNTFPELTSVFNYPGEDWGVSNDIVSITNPTGLRVTPSTVAEDLPLPGKVFAELDDGYRLQIDVVWNTANYAQTPGAYLLEGELTLRSGLTNTQGLKPQIEVTVSASMFEGEGTKGNPYLISTHQQLDSVRHYLGRTDICFRMVNDIDLSVYDTDNDPTNGNWTPIGYYDTPFFSGHFDGGGYTIRNMYINLPNKDDLGLFAAVHGTIVNLGLDNAYLYGNAYLGILAASLNQGTIENCYATGMVKAYDRHAGGLIGYKGIEYVDTPNPVVIRNCYTKVNVFTITSGGGLLAFSAGTSDHVTIENCYAAGSVSADMEWDQYWVQTAGLIGLFVFDNSAGLTTEIKNSVVMSPSVSGSTAENHLARIGNASPVYTKQPMPDGVFNNCYARSDLLLNGNLVTNGTKTNLHGENLTPEELLDKATYTGKLNWDFDQVWGMPEGGGYPVLKTVPEVEKEPDIIIIAPEGLCMGEDVTLQFVSSLENPIFRIYNDPLKSEQLAEVRTPADGKYLYIIRNMPEKIEWFVTVANAATPESKVIRLALETRAMPEIELDVASELTIPELGELSLTATSDENVTWQWFFGETKLEGETGDSFSIPILSKSHAGTYSVVTSNGCSTGAAQTILTVKEAFTIKATYKIGSSNLSYNGTWSSSNVTVTYQANTAGITIQYRLKGEESWKDSPVSLIFSENQDTVYYFRAAKGGIYSEEKPLTVKIDKTEPDFTLTTLTRGEPYTEGETATRPIVFTIEPQAENISGVTYTYCFFSNQANKIPITDFQFTLDEDVDDFLIVEAVSGANGYSSQFMPVKIELLPPAVYDIILPASLPAGIASIQYTDDTAVEEGGSFTFTLVYAPGYGQSKATVWVNDVVLPPVLGNTYTIAGIEEDKTVTIGNATPNQVNPPTPPVTYLVSLSIQIDNELADCISVSPAAGEYYVEENDYVTLSLLLNDDCDIAGPEVYVNGTMIEPTESLLRSASYTYRIRVTGAMDIVVKGIQKNPTAIEVIAGKPEIFTRPGWLMLKAHEPSEVWIYTLTGRLYKNRKISMGTTSIPLPRGFYILRLKDTVRKIVIE